MSTDLGPPGPAGMGMPVLPAMDNTLGALLIGAFCAFACVEMWQSTRELDLIRAYVNIQPLGIDLRSDMVSVPQNGSKGYSLDEVSCECFLWKVSDVLLTDFYGLCKIACLLQVPYSLSTS